MRKCRIEDVVLMRVWDQMMEKGFTLDGAVSERLSPLLEALVSGNMSGFARSRLLHGCTMTVLGIIADMHRLRIHFENLDSESQSNIFSERVKMF
ncbi:Pentatricopeptide repeat superfamily protein [Prunus dulcis]|uniref:Pentatricopeptide repeat superfamily protein n=1 Tax=Prunus dulcis TaxID=3755 RepID=A0A4Y1QQA0_PRUDU|nr:Pentatricopeptide repeat superfamily protein [Prunus dulcis]